LAASSGRGGLIDGEYRRYSPLIARVEGVCAVVAWGVRGRDSKRSRACARWMAEAWLVGKLCEHASVLSLESVGRQSRPEPKAPAREMNDSRYYQPLLLASTILLYPLAQPAISILSPPTPTPPPLPLRRPPIHHGQRRERECECARM
jgi:hypothetical protein